MRQLYAFLAFLAFLSVLFHSVVSVAPDFESRTFLKLCQQPDSWDLVFRNDATPIRDQTPEQVKADLMHFAAGYQPRTEIWMSVGMIISLLIFTFSVIGWFRERHFEKRVNRFPVGPAAELPS